MTKTVKPIDRYNEAMKAINDRLGIHSEAVNKFKRSPYVTVSKKLTLLLSAGYIKAFNSLASYVDSNEFESIWGQPLDDQLAEVLNEEYDPKFKAGKILFVFIAHNGDHISQFRDGDDVKGFIDIAHLYATSEIVW